jgi:putative two-component system response regulator
MMLRTGTKGAHYRTCERPVSRRIVICDKSLLLSTAHGTSSASEHTYESQPDRGGILHQTGTAMQRSLPAEKMVLSSAFEGARILIIDDDVRNLKLLARLLGESGYTSVRVTDDPRCALPLLAEFQPDLIVLDLQMPGMDGFEVMAELQPWIPDETILPILMITGNDSAEVKERALAAGALDFLTKPFSSAEVRLRIRNLLRTRFLHLQLASQNDELEHRVAERTAELERARLEVLERLARAAEYRDDNTGEHTQRVGRTSAMIATALGRDDEEVELIRRAATLHDVGKIGIPDSILLKPGPLTHAEMDVMRGHTKIGARILSGSDVPLLRMAASIAYSHHEHWTGAGYPDGQEGESIPLVGRIVAVADMFDALTHSRPYKEAWPRDRAVAEVRRNSGAHLDPAVVEAFLHVLERIPEARP